ncbi:MAG: ATP-binding protein [Candidatus Fermentibacter sp.]|nr:ATP-binding protein [Candidatus Fermentibacter sp.]
MNRLFLRIYLPLAATILLVLGVAFLFAFKIIPEKAGEYYRNTLAEFRDEIVSRGSPGEGGILAVADSMGIGARVLRPHDPRSGLPAPPPRPGHIFLQGLPEEWGLIVEVPVFPGGRHGPNRYTPLLFVALLVLAEGAVLMTSLKPLRKRLSRLEDAAASIASGDLSARVRTEAHGDIVDSLGKTFNGMADRIQTLISSHQELLGMVAHETRTPLARMRLSLELMRDRGRAADPARLGVMEEDMASMDALLTELLTFNRLSRADGTGMSRVDLGILASEIADSENWSRPDVEVRVEGGAECTADRSMVARALSNVVMNAVRHAAGSVRVRLARGGGGTDITVTDDGTGFDPSLTGRLGRPFVKGPGSPGSGLGLAIVERVASLHGGFVEYSNSPGGGASVRIHLPDR